MTILAAGVVLIALAPLAGAAIAWLRYMHVGAPRELGLDEHLLELAERRAK